MGSEVNFMVTVQINPPGAIAEMSRAPANIIIATISAHAISLVDLYRASSTSDAASLLCCSNNPLLACTKV